MIKLIKSLPQYWLSRNVGLEAPMPINLTVAPSYRCNSRCYSCRAYNRSTVQELTVDEWAKVFKNIGNKVYWTTISGGEPFLYSNLVEFYYQLTKYCKPVMVNIPTNGLLTEKILDNVWQMLKISPQTKLTINVSLDHYVPEKNDDIRGVKGYYSKALETIQELLDHDEPNFTVGIHSVVSRENVQDIPEIAVNLSKILKNNAHYICFPVGTDIVSRCKVLNYENNTYRYSPYTTKIENIKIGDYVLSWNGIEKEFKRVINISHNMANQFILFKFSNGNELRCTLDHPIAVYRDNGINWVLANNIKNGDTCIQYKYVGLGRKLNRLKLRGNSLDDFYGKDKSLEMRLKISKSLIGNKRAIGNIQSEEFKNKKRCQLLNNNPMKNPDIVKKFYNNNFAKGNVRTENGMLSYSLKMKKHREEVGYLERMSNIMKDCWKNQEYIKKQILARNSKPNKLEILIGQILDNICPNEFKYNGDGRLGLYFDGIMPDFVNVNGKKKVIEVYNNYWKKRNYGSVDEYKHIRKERLNNIGFDVLFIEDKEINDLDRLKNKIISYIYNPNVEVVQVINIEYVNNYEDVYNIEVEDNNNYFANGILVHNCEIAENRVELGTMGLKIAPDYLDYARVVQFLKEFSKYQDRSIIRAFRRDYYDKVLNFLNRGEHIPCYAGYASCQITPDGYVVQCCFKYDVMGNLRGYDYDFKKLWTSQNAKNVRELVKRCYGCTLANCSYTNSLLHLPTLINVAKGLLI